MTNTTPPAEPLLKTDVLGRRRMPQAKREEILDEFERSGLTGRKFAELVGLNYQTFATWAQKRRRQRGDYPALPPPPAEKLRWLETVLPASPAQSPLVVQLPGGARLELSDPGQVELAAALLRTLAQPVNAC